MLEIHLLPNFIQSNFKYTIKFVGLNVYLKISYMKIGRKLIYVISLSKIMPAGRWSSLELPTGRRSLPKHRCRKLLMVTKIDRRPPPMECGGSHQPFLLP